MKRDPDLEKAKTYQRKKHFAALLHLGLELGLLIFLILSGATFVFYRWARSLSGHFYVQAGAYYVFFFLFIWIFNVGLGYYSGFRLEEQYGLSNQKFGGWLSEFLKKSLLSFVFSLVLVLGLYFLIRSSRDFWWFSAWMAFAAVSYLLGQLFPVLIVPLFYRYSRVEDETLRERIFRLVKRFDLPLENVYSLNLSKTTKKANAMFAGLGRTKRLVLADTLIQNFTVDEIESVVAHELGHYKHRDIWRHLGFSLVTSLAGFLFVFFSFRWNWFRLGDVRLRPDDLAAFPFLYLLFYLFGLILIPLNNVFSRWLEKEADRFSLQACGPAGFIPAMEKLAQLNLADPNPHPWVEWWFYTHPPISKRIQMGQTFAKACWAILFFLVMCPALGFSKEPTSETEREAARKAVESRAKTEILSYFLGDAKDASGLKTPVAIDLFNQAVGFYQQREYELAKEALQDSLSYDAKNPFAYELLGDIAYNEQDLDRAKKNYESAFRIRAREDLKNKILKVEQERKVESKFATYPEEHFIIKYQGEEKGLEGYELRELLRESYQEVGRDFGYFFQHKVVVLLYGEEEFRELSGMPHWSGGVYDGKIRLPAYRQGFTRQELEKIMRHEVTHAFIADLSANQCPAWLNEGLAEYEEAKVVPPDLRVFRAAVKTGALYPLSSLFEEKSILQKTDPLEVQLFYEETYHLVNYLVERYRMYRIKQMLELFGKGKDSFEAIRETLGISPLQLESQWKETFSQN